MPEPRRTYLKADLDARYKFVSDEMDRIIQKNVTYRREIISLHSETLTFQLSTSFGDMQLFGTFYDIQCVRQFCPQQTKRLLEWMK